MSQLFSGKDTHHKTTLPATKTTKNVDGTPQNQPPGHKNTKNVDGTPLNHTPGHKNTPKRGRHTTEPHSQNCGIYP